MPRPVTLSPVAGQDEATPWARWVHQLKGAFDKLADRCAYEVLVPATGFTHTIPNAVSRCLLTPAAVLATGTITLPANVSDGFEVSIVTSQTVTALTVSPNSGQTIVGTTALTLTAGTQIVYFFAAASSVWYKVQ